MLKENVILEAEKLDEWLDTYQMNNGMLTVVLDACHSGSFLPPLNAQGGQKRIVISSAKAEENARLYNDGILSFSNHFFRYIFNSENVYSAFDKAAAIIKKMPYSQTPQLDDNENGSLAKITFIGNDLVQSISKGPEILSISEPQTISLTTSATIKTIIRSNKIISSVIASIYPPETIFSEDSIKIPSFELIKVSDQPDDSNAAIYTGNYNSFNVQGVYHLSIYATDKDSFTSMPKTTSVVVKNAISNRAIILGSFYDNEWPVTEKNISLAYNTLLSQLYSDKNIDLLSPHAIESIEYAPLSPSMKSLINVFENIPVEKQKILFYI
ncbi:MAG: hypothetical protein OMM_02890 [Candidatus Magnetoglobus multicellularis str. Araruama]|uniref:Uncharacterized protein n=1 Tax=Candidatus Magnetoglobus multicellularis str. Araruama TaxID=890399 RepID=A0A1V1P813_9BACT|nr:MAG: hypothetical protein OMM_02890 [Candidatus Magnetoglobus multicellularis str. Araruama]